MTNYRAVRAIPTTYRGVRMRSKLEARSAAALDRLGIPWVYEPCVYARYLPDFRLWPSGARPWFLEIKPPSLVGDDAGQQLRTALAKMVRIRLTHPDAGLMLWISKPHKADLGVVLTHLPGVTGWAAKPARTVLRHGVRVAGGRRRARWWRWGR